MKRLALIVPSRGRPDNARALMESLKEANSELTDLILVLDDDDPTLREYQELSAKHLVFTREGAGICKPLNKAASFLKDEYKFFAVMGDDVRPRTKDWDKRFIEELTALKTGIVYGDDLHQGKGLPTACAMTEDIVRALGGMAPPNMTHLFVDNFWLHLGKDLNAITYLPDVIVEHLHPVWNTAEWDETYRATNSESAYSRGLIEYQAYVSSQEYQDLLVTLSDQISLHIGED